MTGRDPILDAARRLDRERQPERDLWPGITARLDASRSRPSRHPRHGSRTSRGVAVLAAAAVLAMVLVAPHAVDPGRTPAAGDVRLLDRAYAAARADLARLVADRCDRLPALACAPYVTGLATLDRTAEGLSTALTNLPSDAPERPVLLRRYERTLAEARDLTSRVTRL